MAEKPELFKNEGLKYVETYIYIYTYKKAKTLTQLNQYDGAHCVSCHFPTL